MPLTDVADFGPGAAAVAERSPSALWSRRHYVFAAFVPKFTFSGKKVIGYDITAFDPTTARQELAVGLAHADEESGVAGIPLP